MIYCWYVVGVNDKGAFIVVLYDSIIADIASSQLQIRVGYFGLSADTNSLRILGGKLHSVNDEMVAYLRYELLDEGAVLLTSVVV